MDSRTLSGPLATGVMLADTFIQANSVSGLMTEGRVPDGETLYCVDPAGGQFMGGESVYGRMQRGLDAYLKQKASLDTALQVAGEGDMMAAATALTEWTQGFREKVKQLYQRHGPYIGAASFSGALYGNILGMGNGIKVLQRGRVEDEHVEKYITDMVLCDLLTMYKLPPGSPLLAKYTGNSLSLIPELRRAFLFDRETGETIGSDTELLNEHIKLLISKIVRDRSTMVDILVILAQSNVIWCPVLPDPPDIHENLYETITDDALTPAPSAIVKWYPLSMLVADEGGTVNIDTVPTMCVIHQIGFDFRRVPAILVPPTGDLNVYELIREAIVKIIWTSVIETISALELNGMHTVHSPVLLAGVFAAEIPSKGDAIHNIIHYTLKFLSQASGGDLSLANLPRLQLLNPFYGGDPPAQNKYATPRLKRLVPPVAATIYQNYDDNTHDWQPYSVEDSIKIREYVTGAASLPLEITDGTKRWNIYKGVAARQIVATGKVKTMFNSMFGTSGPPNPRVHHIIEELSRHGSAGEDYDTLTAEQPKHAGDTYVPDGNMVIIQVELDGNGGLTGQIRLVVEMSDPLGEYIDAMAKEFDGGVLDEKERGKPGQLSANAQALDLYRTHGDPV